MTAQHLERLRIPNVVTAACQTENKVVFRNGDVHAATCFDEIVTRVRALKMLACLERLRTPSVTVAAKVRLSLTEWLRILGLLHTHSDR